MPHRKRRPRAGNVDGDESRQCCVMLRDPIEMRFERFARREVPSSERVGERGGGKVTNMLVRCHRTTMPELAFKGEFAGHETCFLLTENGRHHHG